MKYCNISNQSFLSADLPGSLAGSYLLSLLLLIIFFLLSIIILYSLGLLCLFPTNLITFFNVIGANYFSSFYLIDINISLKLSIRLQSSLKYISYLVLQIYKSINSFRIYSCPSYFVDFFLVLPELTTLLFS